MTLDRRRLYGWGAAEAVIVVAALFPVLWMISTAFKPANEIYSLSPQPLPLHPTLANFRAVFSGSVIGMPAPIAAAMASSTR